MNESKYSHLTAEQTAFTNSFVEKTVIEANNTDFVKFRFMNTPGFVDKNFEYNSKVMVAVQSDGTLGVYSLNTGSLVCQFDLDQLVAEVADSNIVRRAVDWANDVVELLTETYANNMRVVVLTADGNCVVFDMRVNRPARRAVADEDAEEADSLHVGLSYGFNVWQTVVDANATKYGDEVSALLQQGLAPVSISYDGGLLDGNFIVGDNKGFFTVVRKRVDRSGAKANVFELNARSYSEFERLELVKNQGFLTLFASANKFSFIRSLDGLVSNTH